MRRELDWVWFPSVLLVLVIPSLKKLYAFALADFSPWMEISGDKLKEDSLCCHAASQPAYPSVQPSLKITVPGYQGSLGTTTIASHVTPIQAFGMEFILSFVITLTFMADPRNSLPTTAALLGATLVSLPATGAGLNPARSLGPAFVMNKWTAHWVFWLAPIFGGLLAGYLHKYILRRGPKARGKKVRESTSDGDSLDDLPTAALPTTTHDRLLVERFEPLYSGTRSLYMKPSPVLPRTNLSRSQSVYASKRLEYNHSKFETLRKQTTPHSTSGPHSHHGHHPYGDSNYESLYEKKSCPDNNSHPAPPSCSETTGGTGGGGNLLMSGPPSYESNYYKTYDTAPLSERGHHHKHGHHKRDPSDLRDNHANRILAQYETSKGLVDVDAHAMKSHKSSLFYESEYSTKEKHSNGKSSNSGTIEKKLIDTCSSLDGDHPPPRFRMQMPTTQQRYPPPGQCSESSDCSRHNSTGGPAGTHGKDLSTFPKKPYELLDTTRKLLDFSPNHSQPNSSLPTPNSTANSNYTARLLMAEKDSTYSRILEPLMNSKPLPPGSNSNNNFSRMSPHDQFMYSYH
ncbi:Neurogenic protein big brain [Folsomia candida]|uniref:Neurogenic protein big brain n=1 Tax=Folsomia candida TaxID=158441 RepID=A0A226EL53_FOLCA|nr:Neurogenic protein big brain [Folsomia candida]